MYSINSRDPKGIKSYVNCGVRWFLWEVLHPLLSVRREHYSHSRIARLGSRGNTRGIEIIEGVFCINVGIIFPLLPYIIEGIHGVYNVRVRGSVGSAKVCSVRRRPTILLSVRKSNFPPSVILDE